MKKIVLLAVLVFFAGMASAQDRPRVTIVNNTGYTVYYVYISQTAAGDWQEDMLDADVLLDGQSITIRLLYPLDVTNRYDVKLEDKDGDTYTKWDILITPNSRIVFTINDLD
ncbi:MAG: hypothetical protein LBK08_07720 [Treponema sp.]|jgi:hypothetical protein|nr:hypothetical protein [Treponema sp.]